MRQVMRQAMRLTMCCSSMNAMRSVSAFCAYGMHALENEAVPLHVALHFKGIQAVLFGHHAVEARRVDAVTLNQIHVIWDLYCCVLRYEDEGADARIIDGAIFVDALRLELDLCGVSIDNCPKPRKVMRAVGFGLGHGQVLREWLRGLF